MIEQWDPPVDPLSCGPSERYALIILKTRQHPYRTLESLQGELEWQFQHGTIKDWTIESIEVCYDLTNSEFATALRQRCWTLHENNLQLLKGCGRNHFATENPAAKTRFTQLFESSRCRPVDDSPELSHSPVVLFAFSLVETPSRPTGSKINMCPKRRQRYWRPRKANDENLIVILSGSVAEQYENVLSPFGLWRS